ncbi:MAG: hypothetical protein ACJAVK_001937 [Akkermansiaceae bacterium]|jgi:hypothetical protein
MMKDVPVTSRKRPLGVIALLAMAHRREGRVFVSCGFMSSSAHHRERLGIGKKSHERPACLR